MQQEGSGARGCMERMSHLASTSMSKYRAILCIMSTANLGSEV